MFAPPKLAVLRPARVFKSRSPRVASPCPHVTLASRCGISASRCRADPLQSRSSAPPLGHSVPLRSPLVPSTAGPQPPSAPRSYDVGTGIPSCGRQSTEQSGPCFLHLARGAHRTDQAADPTLDSPARENAPSCRRQRAPAARKLGVCGRRLGEGGFHGPTSSLTLEEGAWGLFV